MDVEVGCAQLVHQPLLAVVGETQGMGLAGTVGLQDRPAWPLASNLQIDSIPIPGMLHRVDEQFMTFLRAQSPDAHDAQWSIGVQRPHRPGFARGEHVGDTVGDDVGPGAVAVVGELVGDEL